MHTIINNLSLIADAAEYLDRKTGAAWKIRGNLTNSLVWAANAMVRANAGDSVEFKARALITLATLRVWMRDANCSSFVLDLTPPVVRRTLGLERQVNVHDEACRAARQKCLQTRSAAKFKQYYDAAMASFEEQRRKREESVEDICELLSERATVIDAELADYMASFLNIHVEPGEAVEDEELYDNAAVERQIDSLSETLANALESMYDVCDIELAAAITTSKVQRLTGYFEAIKQMMVVVGIDMTKLATRRAKLEAAVDAEIQVVAQSAQTIEADIETQMAQMQAEVEPAPAKQLITVKSPERLAREAADKAAAQARQAEDEAAAKRSAAAKKAAATRKANSLKDLGKLVTAA